MKIPRIRLRTLFILLCVIGFLIAASQCLEVSFRYDPPKAAYGTQFTFELVWLYQDMGDPSNPHSYTDATIPIIEIRDGWTFLYEGKGDKQTGQQHRSKRYKIANWHIYGDFYPVAPKFKVKVP